MTSELGDEKCKHGEASESSAREFNGANETTTEPLTDGLERQLNIGEDKFQQNEVEVIEDFNCARNLVRDCSIVVGLHPDAAAEHIVEYALQNGKPFAVIPCCVYSKLFPARVGVHTYEQLCGYLLAKNCGAQRTALPFEGKNILIWTSK